MAPMSDNLKTKPPQPSPIESTHESNIDGFINFLEKLNAAPHVLGQVSSTGRTSLPSNDSDPPLPLHFQNIFDDLTPQGMADLMERVARTSPNCWLDRVPCANYRTTDNWKCPNPTNGAYCSKCALVVYCSTECQRSHWKVHKRDCKDSLRDEHWVPDWCREMREPNFTTPPNVSWPLSIHPLGLGKSLWGNVPAMDIVHLAMNENDVTVDLDLAFVASGDLRNVLKTVNSLPDNYSGKLTIVINDLDPVVVARNLFILSILGLHGDRRRACDVAIHYWYSVFVPAEYEVLFAKTVMTMATNTGSAKVGEGRSTLTSVVDKDVIKHLVDILPSEEQYGMEEANSEYIAVRFHRDRQDRHHRNYVRLRPSHRLARHEFRRFGLVFPFGAPNSSFNTPNRTLFSSTGKWLQDDMADPFTGWDPLEVILAGAKHGCTASDLYGCLYFYLTDTLLKFADRIDRFDMHIIVTSAEATQMTSGWRTKSKAWPREFDRVDVSNIIDSNYVGLERVLRAWGPYLKRTPHATLVGYSMNWAEEDGSRARATADASDFEKVSGKMKKEKSYKLPDPEGWKKLGPLVAAQKAMAFSIACLHTYTSEFENSAAFETWLKKQGVKKGEKAGGLTRKSKHTILPARLYAPLGAPMSALPEFKDKEEWYYKGDINVMFWSERWVEFGRAT